MTEALATLEEPVGSLGWLLRSDGRLTRRERSYLFRGVFSSIREGFGLRRRARRSQRRAAELAQFEPPDVPIVQAAAAYLRASSHHAMVNHCYRTAFWTLVVLHTEGDVEPRVLETVWVAALLHDVGLEVPPPRGDFSLGGIQILERFAREHAWPEAQVYLASQAIATNLATRVDRQRVGDIAWAMNVGGLGELGFPTHRAQMHPDRVRELEARFPREHFRATAMRLIDEEIGRVPDGRFAFFRKYFRIIVWD